MRDDTLDMVALEDKMRSWKGNAEFEIRKHMSPQEGLRDVFAFTAEDDDDSPEVEVTDGGAVYFTLKVPRRSCSLVQDLIRPCPEIVFPSPFEQVTDAGLGHASTEPTGNGSLAKEPSEERLHRAREATESASLLLMTWL